METMKLWGDDDTKRESWAIPLFTAGAILLWVVGILKLLDKVSR